MTDKQIIQPAVPRSESVRARLAALAWEEGLSAFVTNAVPFSFSSGRVLAGGIAHLVNALAEDEESITVMELGAGIGYLSAFCLDSIADRFPETYQKSQFLVTDGEARLVRDAESRGFSDTVGAGLQIGDFGAQSDGVALAVFNDFDDSALLMTFTVNVDQLGLDFGNDDPGDVTTLK